MDSHSKKRIIRAMRKTLSFALVHFSVALLVGWALTGSFVLGGALALVEPLCNTLAFHLHEKAWTRSQARRRRGTGPTATPA